MSVKRTLVSDPAVQRALEDIRLQSNTLAGGVLRNARFLTESDGTKDLTFSAGVTRTFKHKLGRAFDGFIVVYATANTPVYIDQTNDIAAKDGIALVSTGNITARILIF